MATFTLTITGLDSTELQLLADFVTRQLAGVTLDNTTVEISA